MEKSILLTLKIIGILLGALLLYFVRDLIGYLLLAFVFASALRPVVDWLHDRKVPRFLGGIITFLLILIFFGLVFYFTLPPLIEEIQNFISLFPQYWQNFLLWLPRFEQWVQTTPFGQGIQDAINQSIQRLSQSVTALINFISGLFGWLLNLVLIIVVAFYLTIEKEMDKRIFSFLVIKDKRRKRIIKKKISEYWGIAQVQAGRWLQGYILLSFIVGAMVYTGLSIIGIKYSLILAVLAGILEIIPWLGPVSSALVGSLLAFFQGGWIIALWVLFVFFIVQQIENFIIVPFLMKKRVDLDPILTLIVLFIGGKLGGVLGMILAVPVSAILLGSLKGVDTTTQS